MDHLWSPWRMAYLRGEDAPAPGCVFCHHPAQNADADYFIVHRGQHAYVILNLYPYNNGHMLVVPYQHVATFEQLDPPALTEIMTLANEAVATLRRMYQPQAFNLGANI